MDPFAAARVARLFLYPIKSLDGLAVDEAAVTPAGPLQHDRAWVLTGSDGEVVTGKRNPRVHAVRPEFDLVAGTVTIARQTLALGSPDLDALLSDALGERVALLRVPGGAPDHRRAPGPTVISRATLESISGWYGWSDVDEARRRLRPSIVIAGVEPFGEERLLGRPFRSVEFSVGEAVLRGLFACARCAVPARDPDSGTPTPGFQKTFVARRKASFPGWGTRSAFPHHYHAAVLTRVARAGRVKAGDRVRIGRERWIDLEWRLVVRTAVERLEGAIKRR